MSLVADPNNIRLGIAGKVDENDHPYSWAAIVNGYDPTSMRAHAAPMISDYLAARQASDFGIAGVRVSHVWCDDPDQAKKVATAARVGSVLASPQEMIGRIDAVLIPTDRGDEHVARARPFVDAGVPVFIDKPLCDNLADLRTFQKWVDAGKAIMSCSAFRYSVEFASLGTQLSTVGELRHTGLTMAKSWRRYGMHALEGAYPLFAPGGWVSARNAGDAGAEIVTFVHQCGARLTAFVGEDWFGGFGSMHVVGTGGELFARYQDSFSAFKAQLEAFVSFLRTGMRPFPFAQTVELTQMLVAGEQSRLQGGAIIALPQSPE